MFRDAGDGDEERDQRSERKARLEKARRLMSEQKVDAMLLTGGTSLDYFTGMRWGLSERLTGVVIPKSGNAFIVTPKFEEERTLEQARTGPLGAASHARIESVATSRRARR